MNSNDKYMDDIIKQAGMKAGVNPETLKNNIDNGKLDNLVSKMRPQDAAKFKQAMSNPQMAQQLLNTPQAQMLIKRFMGN